jgi:hypothetical protein
MIRSTLLTFTKHTIGPGAAAHLHEAAAQKKFDWALQKLLESQQRRQKAQAPRERSGFKRSVTSHYLLPTSNP